MTNLLDFLNYVNSNVDKGEAVDAVYLDFQKAFDKVPHRRLLVKLRGYGFVEDIVSWIEGWLRNRLQRVVLNGCMSSWCQVVSGVPQCLSFGAAAFFDLYQ